MRCLRVPSGCPEALHTMHQDSPGCMTVHSPATGLLAIGASFHGFAITPTRPTPWWANNHPSEHPDREPRRNELPDLFAPTLPASWPLVVSHPGVLPAGREHPSRGLRRSPVKQHRDTFAPRHRKALSFRQKTWNAPRGRPPISTCLRDTVLWFQCHFASLVTPTPTLRGSQPRQSHL
jgi:hypothetical protein